MSSEQVSGPVVVALVGAVALAVVLATLAVVAVRSASRRSRELADALERAEARAGELADRLARLEQRDRTSKIHQGVVVQRDGAPVEGPLEGAVVPERIEGRLFADIVAREAAVKAASWTHGVRRALAPEVRNRIRFEMRRELKRARKQRRADLKAALRDLQARERAAMRAEQERDEGDAA